MQNSVRSTKSSPAAASSKEPQKKIEENKDLILLSKDLATIRRDVPVGATPDSLTLGKIDEEKLFAIFRDLEFRNLADRIKRRIGSGEAGRDVAAAPSKPSAPTQPSLFDFDEEEPQEEAIAAIAPDTLGKDCKTADTPADIAEMKAAIAQAGTVGVSMQTDGDNDMEARWNATAFAIADGRSWLLDNSTEGATEAALEILADPDIMKICSSAKRDMVVARCRRADGTDNPDSLVNFHDVAIAHYLLEPELRHTPELLAEKYLGYTLNPLPPRPNSRH